MVKTDASEMKIKINKLPPLSTSNVTFNPNFVIIFQVNQATCRACTDFVHSSFRVDGCDALELDDIVVFYLIAVCVEYVRVEDLYQK